MSYDKTYQEQILILAKLLVKNSNVLIKNKIDPEKIFSAFNPKETKEEANYLKDELSVTAQPRA